MSLMRMGHTQAQINGTGCPPIGTTPSTLTSNLSQSTIQLVLADKSLQVDADYVKANFFDLNLGRFTV